MTELKVEKVNINNSNAHSVRVSRGLTFLLMVYVRVTARCSLLLGLSSTTMALQGAWLVLKGLIFKLLLTTMKSKDNKTLNEMKSFHQSVRKTSSLLTSLIFLFLLLLGLLPHLYTK
jgi:hypothetical protein